MSLSCAHSACGQVSTDGTHKDAVSSAEAHMYSEMHAMLELGVYSSRGFITIKPQACLLGGSQTDNSKP